MVHSLLHWWVEVVLQLLEQYVANCDTSVLHKTKRFHHQQVVVVVEVMPLVGFLVACLQDILEVIQEQ